MRQLKTRVMAVIIILTLILSANIVFAGSYTNSNPYANSSYNRANAATYASSYAITANPSYYDYTPIGGDCTNFVSQCLGNSGAGNLTQGYDLIRGGWPLYSSNYSWYYIAKALPGGVSYTWSGAANFRRHWANESGTGVNRSYKYVEYANAQAVINDWTNVYYMLWRGDLIQLVRASDGTAHHSMIIYEFKYNSTYGVVDLIYAQHTGNKKDQSFYSNLKSWVSSGITDKIVIYEIKSGS